MPSIIRKIPYAHHGDTFRLWHLTDWHLGAAACDERLLDQHIKMIADDPHAYWIGGGDYIDCISRVGDKRYDEDTTAPWLRGVNDVIDAQCERFFAKVQPIARKCLALVNGNHEHNALRYYNRDVYTHLVRGAARMAERQVNEIALGIGGFLLLRFIRRSENAKEGGEYWTLKIFAHHGAGGGRLAGGHALQLERVLGDFECDLALLGHRHRGVVVTRAVTTVTTRGDIRVQTRVGMQSASYMRSFSEKMQPGKMPVSTYAEHMLLPATMVGASPITIIPARRSFAVQMLSSPAVLSAPEPQTEEKLENVSDK